MREIKIQKQLSIEKEIEYLRFAMREPCGCKVCEDERANIGDNCVIRQALTEAHQAGIDEAMEVIREEMIRYPDTGKVQEDAYNYALLNAEKAIKALQDNK